MSRFPRPRKRFGQHFLHDPGVISRIMEAIQPVAGDIIVEIGPGRGALTTPLAHSDAELHLVEFDRDLAAALRTRFAGAARVHVHEADALRFDFAQVGDRLRIVGNLPYNISTPLLFHLLASKDRILDMHFMLQKEVVARICAEPGTKRYGRLTVMLGSVLDAYALFDVAPDAFLPPPRVVSSVLRLTPTSRYAEQPVDHEVLSSLLGQAFGRRRKTLHNALKGAVTDDEMRAAGIAPEDRPEQVAIESWLTLVRMLNRQ